jgi:hypothetical protein
MARARFWILTLVVGALLSSTNPTGWANDQSEASTCKVYSLAKLGDDPEIVQWIANTIPQVIEPETWLVNALPTATLDGRRPPREHRTLSYYAPAKILVVYHTPKIHAEVERFLKNLEKALPRAAEPTSSQGAVAVAAPAVTPAQYVPPQAIADSVRSASVESPKKQPKHLFHIIVDGVEFKSGDQESKLKNFTLRYEGEGIIDSNVAKVLKAMWRQGAAVVDYGPASITPSWGYPTIQPTPPFPPPCGAVSQNVYTPTSMPVPTAPTMPLADALAASNAPAAQPTSTPTPAPSSKPVTNQPKPAPLR